MNTFIYVLDVFYLWQSYMLGIDKIKAEPGGKAGGMFS